MYEWKIVNHPEYLLKIKIMLKNVITLVLIKLCNKTEVQIATIKWYVCL